MLCFPVVSEHDERVGGPMRRGGGRGGRGYYPRGRRGRGGRGREINPRTRLNDDDYDMGEPRNEGSRKRL